MKTLIFLIKISYLYRLLDHNLDPDNFDNADDSLRAPTTDLGHCIIYNESLTDHFDRVGVVLGIEPRILSDMDIGLRRGLPLYGLGMQGSEGDQKTKKPWFGDIVGGMKWDAWDKLKGQSKELC